MPKPRKNPNLPQVKKENVGDVTKWDIDVNRSKIPYVSHAPKNPMKMTKARKARIKKVLRLKEEGKEPKEIAETLGVSLKTIKRDLTTAIVLAKENLPYLPAEDKQLLHKAISTYNDEARTLFDRIKTVITELEDKETYLQPKAAMAYAMILGELRQTLELGAKLSGELQTGTKVNVVIFSNLVKRMIEIINQEVDRSTFIRIRERMKLEMQGQQPLGEKGGVVEVIEDEQQFV